MSTSTYTAAQTLILILETLERYGPQGVPEAEQLRIAGTMMDDIHDWVWREKLGTFECWRCEHMDGSANRTPLPFGCTEKRKGKK